MKYDLTDVIKSQINTYIPNIYTCMPATVLKAYVNGSATVVDVQPLIDYRFQDGTGIKQPVLSSVPVQWPAGGGASLTFPIGEGDMVLLLFCMTSLDEWKHSDGNETIMPLHKRYHDLSDAVAIPSVFTTVKHPTQENVSSVVLKHNDGSSAKAKIEIEQSGKIIINAGSGSTIELGEGAAESVILGDAFKTYFDAHTHPTGVGPSGTPITPMPPTTLSQISKVK